MNHPPTRSLATSPAAQILAALCLRFGLALLAVCATPVPAGEVTATLTPTAITSSSEAPVVLHVTGLTPGSSVVIERIVDTNANGIIDPEDFIAGTFSVTDGQVTAIAGVRNTHVPGDEDLTADGQISVHLHPTTGPELGRLAGGQIIRVSSPAPAFPAFTRTLAITHPDQAQSISGIVTDGIHPVPHASVVLFDTTPAGGFSLGALADSNGQYAVSAPVGSYAVTAFKRGYVTTFDAAPQVALGAGNALTQNLELMPATTLISGAVTNDDGLGVGGIQLFAWSPNGLAAITSSNLTGAYSLPVTAGPWQIQTSAASVSHLGYLSRSGETDAAADTTNAAALGINISLPKVTALIHGTVADASANPLPGILMGASDSRHLFTSDAITDANGHYVLGVTTGTWETSIANGGLGLSGYVIPSSKSVTITGAEAVKADFSFGAVNSAHTTTSTGGSIMSVAGNGATISTLSSVATLSGFVFSTGALKPAFISTTLGYTQVVPNSTTSLTVKPTATHVAATLTLNTQPITSGTTSDPIALSPGLNTVTVLVTAQDGVTTKSYTVNVTRLAPPVVATLGWENLTAVGAKLNGTVNGLNSSTTVSFEYGTTLAYGKSATATPSPVVSSVATPVTAILSALTPSTTYHYRIKGVSAGGTSHGDDATFTTPSNIATLSGLVLSTGILKPAFIGTTTGYTQIVPSTTTTVTVKPTAASPVATLLLNGGPFTSDTTSDPITLAPGLNVITVQVTAQDGLTIKTYTVGVTQLAEPVVATLPATNLKAIGARLNGTVQAFNSSTTATFEYGLTTGYGHTAAAAPSPVSGNGTTGVSATVTGLTPLTLYHFRIKGVSAGGAAASDDATFTTPNNVATLSDIGISSGTLSPVFKTTVTSYTATVSNDTNSITVTPALSDANASAKVNGLAAAPGATINLIVGVNTLTIIGTAQDGTTTKTYTLKVTRQPALASLTTLPATNVSATTVTFNGVVNTAYDTSTKITFEYGLTTKYGSTITATPATVGGTVSTNVSATPKGLKSGVTYHYRVKGVNGAGASTGTDTTTATPSNVATLSSLVLSSGALKPAFASGTTGYTQTVLPAITSLSVTATASSSVATLKLNGGDITSGNTNGPFTLSPGLNSFTVQVTAEDGVTTKSYTVSVTQLALPVVATGAAANIGATGATLTGTVNALNSSTTVSFDFGQTTAYGKSIAAKPSPVTGSSVTAVAAAVGSLLPNTTYHYRARGVSAGGTATGDDVAFTTRSLPPTLTLNVLPHAQVGQFYGQQVGVASGGIPTYAFTVGTGGGFPPIGIHMDASGFLSGTPSIEGPYTFDVSVVDLVGSETVKTTTLIVDPPGLTISDVSANEGNSGTTDFVFTVTLSAASTRTVTVKYATANGTASAPGDYTAIPSTLLSFAAGETSKDITVHVNGDTTYEPNETFYVNLTVPQNATITKTKGTGTIINDDSPAGSEVWTGTFTGNTVGAFYCLFGDDAYYDVAGTVRFTVPAPGMVALLDDIYGKTFGGSTLSLAENAVAAACTVGDGASVSSNSVTDATLQTTVVYPVISVTSTSVLIHGVFVSGGNTDQQLATKIVFSPDNITANLVSGTWQSYPPPGAGVSYSSGTFVFQKQ